MKIYKNFLPQADFNYIKNILLSENFPWYRSHSLVTGKDKLDTWFHLIYRFNKPNSDWYKLLEPLILAIRPVSLIRIRINLYTPASTNSKTAFHQDIADGKHYTTGCFYITKNNGPTEFKNKTIYPEENMYVVFPSTEVHRAVLPTDKDKILINFNYFQSEKNKLC